MLRLQSPGRTVTLLETLKKAFRPAKVWQPIILESSGFRSGDAITAWSDVLEIAAFKQDKLTWDDVWFQFKTATGFVLVCEEQPGFAQFEAAVIALFPSTASWREQVIQPAFAENFTVLYQRAS